MKGSETDIKQAEGLFALLTAVERFFSPADQPQFINSLTGETYFSRSVYDLAAARIKPHRDNPESKTLEQEIAPLEQADQALAFNSYPFSMFLLLEYAASQSKSFIVIEPVPAPLELIYSLSGINNKIKMIRVAGGQHVGQNILDTVEQEDDIPGMIFMAAPDGYTRQMTDICQVSDITGILGIEQQQSCMLVVENSSLGPWFQKPLSLGADLVLASLPEYIGGGKGLNGGIIAGKEMALEFFRTLRQERKWHLGAQVAGIAHNFMETGFLRKRGASENAVMLASALAIHPEVKRVFHPSLLKEGTLSHTVYFRQSKISGARLSFDLGNKTRAYSFLDNLQRIKISPFPGLNTSVAYHACYHQPALKNSIIGMEGVVTIIAGVENGRDLLEDVMTALKSY